jgi:hypothetical protein
MFNIRYDEPRAVGTAEASDCALRCMGARWGAFNADVLNTGKPALERGHLHMEPREAASAPLEGPTCITNP